jgi:hypothetical protein
MLKHILYIVTIVIILLIINEISQGFIRQRHRQIVYKMAEKRAKQLDKPLVVFGDPYHGRGSRLFSSFMDHYGCGDETVDLTGAPKCPNGIKSDILKYLKEQPSNSKVIFISCVLEYIENIEEVIDELVRVAGSNENIFIVSVSEYTYAAYFYKEDEYKALNVIKGPPFYEKITYRRI